jgi:hypothetical protein
MGDPRRCGRCGGDIPADAPGGACPRCALAAALPGAAGEPTPEDVAAKLPAFDILGVLGRGGMGVVFKARQRALDRVVALKVLPPATANAPGFSERFAREAKAMARLSHPNIVAVHDFGETAGLFWLVLEFVDGLNVREAMRAGRVGPAEALRIVPQICDALQYAHDRGVVHRDIKPENVLIGTDGVVKIADFGLAKLADRDAGDPSLTGASQVMGTLHYMAPEQWERPKEVDHRADIYSLGVVFYEMLTGELPVGRFEPPSHRARIDVRVDDVVMRSLERNREQRWQRADEVKSHVGAITGGAAPSPAPAAAPPSAPPPPAAAVPPAPWLAPGLRALAACAAIVAFAVFCWAADTGSPAVGAGPGTLAVVLGVTLAALALIRYRLAKVTAAPLGPPVLLIVVSCASLVLGAYCVVNAGIEAARRRAKERDAEAALLRRAEKKSTARGRAPWEFEIALPPGEDASHQASDDDRRALWSMWTKAQSLQGSGWSDALRELYPHDDFGVLGSMTAERRDAAVQSRTLGPVFLPAADADLAKFRLERVTFGGWTTKKGFTTALVDATDGTRTLRFPMRRAEPMGASPETWLFMVAPVELR